MDNGGCSGGTGVEVQAFRMSEMSQNEFNNEMGVMDNSLLKIAQKGSMLLSTDHNISKRSMSPIASPSQAERIQIVIQNSLEQQRTISQSTPKNS
jgi:hypothetical protein